MDVFLLRHGDAEPAGPGGDAARPLSKEGREEVRRVAQGIERLGVAFDRIVSSPLLRARETAEIVAATVGYREAIEQSDLLFPGASPEATRALLVGAPKSILFVGHEPHMSAFVGYLTGGAVRMKKASLAKVGLDGDRGTLAWLQTARQLRLIGKT